MKYRLIASVLVVVVLAFIAILTEQSGSNAHSVSVLPSADDQSLKSFKMP